MREILFRGKKVGSEEWVIGYYVKQYGAEQIYLPSGTDGEYSFDYYHINPKTIGQYTGLTSKNGKKIFEGDILAFSDRLVYVHWHGYCGCWDCSYIKEIKGEATSHEDRSPDKWRCNAKVVGNIHDNPELLKGGVE